VVECSPGDECVEIFDDLDQVVGTATRSECHGRPDLIHRAAHVLVFNHLGELLLQKRADTKLIQPGRWDSSVGGHLDPGETYRQAAVREMEEELGISGMPLTFLFGSRIRNQIESENIETFLALHDGPFAYAEREISEIRFWTEIEIEGSLGSGVFTPNFEDEWQLFKEWRIHYQQPGEGLRVCAGDSFPDLIRALQNT